ncbi:hypothetical protein OKW41_000285 [Paraburkholderia sp. UCT70]
MVLFHDVVEILDLADLDRRLTLGVHGVQPGQIGTTLVDGYGFRHAILIDGLLEVPSGRFLVPPGSQQKVNRVAGLVDGAVQIGPLPLDFEWSKRQGVVELFPGLSSPNRTCASQRIRLSAEVSF